MQLFAIMDDSIATKILRIETDSDAQKEVSRIFNAQYSLFSNHHTELVSFCAGYTPTYSEIFHINNFTEAAMLHDAIERNTAVPAWDPSVIPMENIKAIFTGDTKENTVLLQTFDKRQILNIEKSFFLSSNVFKMASSVGFNIADKLSAVIIGNQIRFKSIKILRGAFDMDAYFREATNSDLQKFVQQSKFHTPNDFDLVSIADTPIRTKVTLINSSGILDTDIKILKRAAKKIKFSLNTEIVNNEEKIVMPPSKKEIKELLSFLDQDIFTAEITKTIYKSTSKRPYS